MRTAAKRRLGRAVLAGVTLATWACAPRIPGPPDGQPHPGFVVAPEEAARLLTPCTAPAPPAADSTWTPTLEQVRALERELPAYAAAASWRRPGFGPTHPLRDYIGQYTGFYRGGTRWIYGRFGLFPDMPKDSLHGLRVKRWCGGGGRYFGVEYSPETGEFRQLRRDDADVVER